MSLKVIEFNDHDICVSDETGILLHSPGFALADGAEVLFGEAAEQQARLRPTESYNRYWQELSLDPISHGNSFRHYADIAYAHLLHLAEVCAIQGEVIFAVPGSFTHQQLAILLGLAKQTPFTVIGVVDSSAAAAATRAKYAQVIYLDLQLHQALVSSLKLEAGVLQTETTVQVPGVGSQSFMNLMMQIATNLFIQQCRFNPQHNAESEQQLYNTLPHWLGASDDGNLILELATGETSHTAKMPHEALVSSLRPQYAKISDQVLAMQSNQDCQLMISPAIAALPGFAASLPSSVRPVILKREALTGNVLQFVDLIAGTGESIQLVNSLPVSEAPSPTSPPALDQGAPSHILFRHHALPVEDLPIENRLNPYRESDSAPALVLSIQGMPALLGHICLRDGEVRLKAEAAGMKINGSPAAAENRLRLGDEIQFEGCDDRASLIWVSHGQR